jgi:hypothetical protein
MTPVAYHGRPALRWENEHLRITALTQGGHIAEVWHKSLGLNPLWTPPWPIIDPLTYNPTLHAEYGPAPEAQLLSGIAGHNWCVDLFGPPSTAEAAAGYCVHGEASVVTYDTQYAATLPLSQLRVQRHLELDGLQLHFLEVVENLLPFDRSIAWQEHVTFGPPFVEPGVTFVDAPVLRSMDLNEYDYEWTDRRYPLAVPSASVHGHLLTRGEVRVANPRLGLALRYEWNLQDFPWLTTWVENQSRTHAPWLGRTTTWGIEFGASPLPETRFRRATRGLLSGAPTAVWLPAFGKRQIAYTLTVEAA